MISSSWSVTRTLSVQCTTNAMGGTDVVAVFDGQACKPITYDDYNVDEEGLDQLKNRIEATVLSLISSALRAAS